MKNITVDSKLVARAHAFAVSRHGEQKYGPVLPYSRHLAWTVDVVRRFMPKDHPDYHATLAAAWLHDVIEDTATTYDEVRDEFGSGVADLVYAVTDGPGRNRRERKLATYPKIVTTPGATFLKLCDRIANVEGAIQMNSPFIDMYRREHREFTEALRDRGENLCAPLWAFVSELLFPATSTRGSN